MTPGEPTPRLLSRRQLTALAAAGGSAALLAACGTDPDPNADRPDEELLGDVFAALSALSAGYARAASPTAPLAAQVRAALADVRKAITRLGAKPPAPGPRPRTFVAGEQRLVAATLAVTPDLDTSELRRLAYRVVAESAARQVLITPDAKFGAFVLGDATAS